MRERGLRLYRLKMMRMVLCLREELISGELSLCLLIVSLSTKLLREMQI